MNQQIDVCPADCGVVKPPLTVEQRRAQELDRCLTNDSLLSVIYEQSSLSESDLEDTISLTDNMPDNMTTENNRVKSNEPISDQNSHAQPTNSILYNKTNVKIKQDMNHKITINDPQKDNPMINHSFNTRLSINENDDRDLGMSLGFDTDEQTYDSSACESFQVTDREDSSVCSTVRSAIDVEEDEDNVVTLNVSMKLDNPQDDDVHTIKVHITPNEQNAFPTSSQTSHRPSPRVPRLGKVNINVECSEEENGTTPRQKYESTTSFEIIDDEWSVTRSEASESEGLRSDAESRLLRKTKIRDHISRSKKSRHHQFHDSTVFSSFEVLGSRNSVVADSERSEKVSFKFSPHRFRKKKNRSFVSVDNVTETSSPSLNCNHLNDSYLFSSFEHLDDSFYFKRTQKASRSVCSSFLHLDQPDTYLKSKGAEDSGFSSLSAERGIPNCGSPPGMCKGDVECMSSGDEYGGLTINKRCNRVEMKDRPKRKMKKKTRSWLMCAPFLCSK